MTYAPAAGGGARGNLVTIIEGTTPTDARLYDTGFRERKDEMQGASPQSRSFTLVSEGPSSLRAPLALSVVRAVATMALTIFYRHHTRMSVVDAVIEQDRIDLCRRLANPALWDGAHVVTITSSGEGMFPAQRTAVDGGIEQRIVFPLEYIA